MRTYDEVIAAGRERPAFSNGSEGYAWEENNCGRCVHDQDFRLHGKGSGCVILQAAILGYTPSEWLEKEIPHAIGDRYTCIEFRDRDERDYEPKPLPVDPDQLELIPADPYRGVRMFVQPQPIEVSA